MPFYRGLDIPGDLALTADGRDISFTDNVAVKVLQNITTRAQIFKGSWRYDRKLGVPYFQEIMVAGANMALVRRRFYEMLAGTPDVTSVLKLTVQTVGETLQVTFTVQTPKETVSGSLAFA